MDSFLTQYTKIMKDDVRRNRNNAAERLGFLGRVIHGTNPGAWLKEIRQRPGGKDRVHFGGWQLSRICSARQSVSQSGIGDNIFQSLCATISVTPESGSGSALLQDLGSGWEREMKGCSAPGVGSCPQMPSMRLDNGTADRQPHAAALRLGSEERVENLIRIFNRQSDSCVADFDHHSPFRVQLRLEDKYSACVFHRLDAVEHKVHEHLLQLHTICHYSWEPFGNIGTHCH